MDDFTPIASTTGGVLIGLSASMMLVLHGRVAGISGILGGILERRADDLLWRVLFVLGLVAGGIGFAVAAPDVVSDTLGRTPVYVVVAGLLAIQAAPPSLGSRGFTTLNRMIPATMLPRNNSALVPPEPADTMPGPGQ